MSNESLLNEWESEWKRAGRKDLCQCPLVGIEDLEAVEAALDLVRRFLG